MHVNFLSNGNQNQWQYLWIFGSAKCAIFKLRLQAKYNNFLPNRIIAWNIGFQRPVTSSLWTAFTRIVVGPTNLKRPKRHSLRSGESTGMQYELIGSIFAYLVDFEWSAVSHSWKSCIVPQTIVEWHFRLSENSPRSTVEGINKTTISHEQGNVISMPESKNSHFYWIQAKPTRFIQQSFFCQKVWNAEKLDYST